MPITSASKPGFTLAWISACLAFIVVLLGAYTRLTDAGLGCPDWPGCYGFASVPQGAEQIELAQSRYPHAPVEAHKAWPEVVHRYFAGTLGLLVFANLLLAVRNRRRPQQPMALPALLMGLVVLQGLFGMWTVTLKLWPQVVTSHLLGGFATLTLLWLLALNLSGLNWADEKSVQTRQRSLHLLAKVGLLLLIAQIALGGWTSSNYAALACPDLPTCQMQWWPEMDFHAGFNLLQDVGPSYLGGLLHNSARMAIHMTHRLGALAVTTALLLLAFGLLRHSGKSQKKIGCLLLLVLMTQLTLGLGNVLLQLPLPIAVAHNGVAALLLLVVTTINYGFWTDRTKRLL